MRSGLIAMSEADPAAVKTYLLRRQIEPEIVDWKYFDPCFNRGRERGVILVRENQVAGFLGLIPFRLRNGEMGADCAWSCDWSVESSQAAGMGLLLLKRARELYDGIFNLGGNENTRRIFPRLADRTIADAGFSFVLPLRLGSIFARLPRGKIRDLLNRRKTLQRIPVRWVPTASKGAVTIDQGVAPGVAAMFDKPRSNAWRPLYDSQFIDWQFRRCPSIQCWSCWISSESPLQTAALIWRSRHSPRYWRFVLVGDTGKLDKLKALLTAIISFVYSEGCLALFAIASHKETDVVRWLRRSGFIRYATLPFYVVRGRDSRLLTDEFSSLNFLDTDLAYRFEQEQP